MFLAERSIHIGCDGGLKTRNKEILLLLTIFCFSFLFRASIIFHNPYPPSSDIGLHGSIIKLILDEGTLPTWNPYHMGGETLSTPPGFHYFVTILILFTGMPIILAQLITAAFFSSIIVFPAYLVSKKIWKNPNTGLIAAFFASISALSTEMISWGGYTNIVSLFLIISIFYLFLKENNKPNYTHIVTGTLFFSTLIITHTFSLSIFLPILTFYLVLLIAGKIRKLKEIKILNMLRFFAILSALGIVIVLPWVLRVFNFYFGASSEGALTGGLDNRNLILANRSVEPEILTLIFVLIPAFFMLKGFRKRFSDSSSLFLLAWFLVPIILTQAYIFGIYTDYSRFMYFIDFPGIIIISAGLLYLLKYTTVALNRFSKIRWTKIKKVFPLLTFTLTMFIFIIASLWSIFPHEGMKRANYYSTIQEEEGFTLEWINNNTSKDSILAADHLYGWWLGGIGGRVTLSAANLEFLIYSHELEVAKDTQLLLDTNYYIDNGLIQVREDAGFLVNKTLDIGIDAWNGESFPIFSVKEEGIYFEYYQGENNETRTFSKMEIVGIPSMIRDENSITFLGQYEDDLFTVNRTLIIKSGIRFAELSYDIGIKDLNTNLYHLFFPIYLGQGSMTIPNYEFDSNITQPEDVTYSWFGFYYWDQVCGEVIFEEDIPGFIEYIEDEPRRVEVLFRYKNPRIINIKMQIGVFDAENLTWPELKKEYLRYLNAVHETTKEEPISVWDYSEMVKKYDVSYVVYRDKKGHLRFAADPKFRLILNSGNIAVFQVVK